MIGFLEDLRTDPGKRRICLVFEILRDVWQ